MNRKILVRTLALLVVVTALTSFSRAQQTIRCESNDGRRNYCNADTRGGVTMIRQISGASCVQGNTWGYDGRGIWVDRGCRAEFQVGGGWNGGGGGGGTIRCESNDGRRNYCNADTRGGVTLIRQISGASCIQGNTWGYDGRGIWVDRGCRAEFQVGGGWNGGGGGWGRGTIRCESNDGRRNYCNADTRGGVTLIRQISGASCIQGNTWGFDGRGIWVDRGCRAEFQVGGGWNGGGGGGGPWNPPVSNYPRVKVDTSGRGLYNGPYGNNVRITRGYVTTNTGQPSVGLSGPNFSLAFYGDVIRSDGNRELTLRINRTDRGPANGTATAVLNNDRNEVETISIDGAGFNGSFSR